MHKIKCGKQYQTFIFSIQNATTEELLILKRHSLHSAMTNLGHKILKRRDTLEVTNH